MKTKRNDPCHCGSGKKYKKCCMQSETGLSGTDILGVVQQLVPTLDKAAEEQYGAHVRQAGWRDFSRWGLEPIARDESAYREAFQSWYLFAWLPDDSTLDGQSFDSALSEHSIAYDFLKAHRKSLSPVQQGVIEVATTAPYSFYSVGEVAVDGRLHLREMYTQRDVVVETGPTHTFNRGDLLFTAVISVNNVAVLLGCMPIVLSEKEQAVIQTHRAKWVAEEGGSINQRLLYLHDTELRRLYFLLLSKKQKASLH